MDRRRWLKSSLALGAGALLPGAAAEAAPWRTVKAPQPFDLARLQAMARARAARPYVSRHGHLPAAVADLTWDQYQSIRFRSDHALWRDAGNRFAWIWLVGVVLCFSAISGKNPYYLLPDFAAFALLLAVAADARPRLGIAAALSVLAFAIAMLGAHAIAARIRQPFPDALLTSLPLAGAALAVVGIALWRWRSLPAQAFGLLLALAIVHAGLTPLLKAQFDFTPTATLLGEAQRAGTKIAFLGEYQLQFHFAGRLHAPVEVVDEAEARAWAQRHPCDLIVVNALDAWHHPGARPVLQQRWRTRWVQVWRAGDWRALPAQQLPLQSGSGQRRYQPR